MIRQAIRFACAAMFALLSAPPALAQNPADDDAVLKPAEPDYTIVSLPTSLRLPPLGSAFRVTHRFIRPLNCSDDQQCPDGLVGDLFGLDNGAYVGLEFRFGIVEDAEIGIHRARGEKTIDLFGQYGLTRQSEHVLVEMALRLSIEGTNNFRDVYSPTLTLIATRLIGESASLHIEPIWVGNSNLASNVGDDSTFMVGLGGRLRILPTVYVVAEFVPRLSGYKPDSNHGSIALEKRAGGHLFQVTFSNDFATTLGQIARGGSDNWYLGFNLSRKFF